VVETVKSYKDLRVWQQAMALARECYTLTQSFPREELFGMVSQVRRAAVSVPANIAEGSGRGTTKDYIQFLRVARGSLRELETHLLLCRDVALVSEGQIGAVTAQIDSVSILLEKLIRSLQNRHSRPLNHLTT
jgi:four helix bundle protein